MKKTIRLFLALAMIFCVSVSVYAAYPASTDHGCLKPEVGELIEGELFGAASWSGSDYDSFERAWDGDPYSYYDPANGGTDACYTGIQTESPYVITEVRILPREGWLDRFKGAEIQGSNDGENWDTIWISSIEAKDWKYHTYTGTRIDCPKEGYTMFRYVNKQMHGDIGEIELYGIPAVDEEAEALAAESAAESEQLQALLLEREEIAKHVMTSPSSSDPMTILIVLVVVSGALLIGMTVVSKILKNRKK